MWLLWLHGLIVVLVFLSFSFRLFVRVEVLKLKAPSDWRTQMTAGGIVRVNESFLSDSSFILDACA
jgi:hypothetical protein